jgi:hypothetical protein
MTDNETIRFLENESKLMDEIITVRHIKNDGTIAKKIYYNVRIDNEVKQLWFGTKRAAKAYLTKHSNQHKTLCQVFADEGVG